LALKSFGLKTSTPLRVTMALETPVLSMRIVNASPQSPRWQSAFALVLLALFLLTLWRTFRRTEDME